MFLQACAPLLVDFYDPNVAKFRLRQFSATVPGEGIFVARVDAEAVAFAVPAVAHDREEGAGVRRYQERRPVPYMYRNVPYM